MRLDGPQFTPLRNGRVTPDDPGGTAQLSRPKDPTQTGAQPGTVQTPEACFSSLPWSCLGGARPQAHPMLFLQQPGSPWGWTRTATYRKSVNTHQRAEAPRAM